MKDFFQEVSKCGGGITEKKRKVSLLSRKRGERTGRENREGRTWENDQWGERGQRTQ